MALVSPNLKKLKSKRSTLFLQLFSFWRKYPLTKKMTSRIKIVLPYVFFFDCRLTDTRTLTNGCFHDELYMKKEVEFQWSIFCTGDLFEKSIKGKVVF
jgi:hypothetical protein